MEFTVGNMPKPPRPERIIELIRDHLSMKSNQRGGWIEVPMTKAEYELIIEDIKIVQALKDYIKKLKEINKSMNPGVDVARPLELLIELALVKP